MHIPRFEDLKERYRAQWDAMRIPSDAKHAELGRIAQKLVAHKATYQSVMVKTGVPWFMIAVIHERESDANFHTHLHNGDPLTHRTVHVPSGRPRWGKPPFTWEESAVDALDMRGLDNVHDWSIERICYELEAYNGWGYRMHGVPSAYLWSWSSVYKGGKYIADGVWSDSKWDPQPGCMPLIARMMNIDQSIKIAGLGIVTPEVAPMLRPEPEPQPVSQETTHERLENTSTGGFFSRWWRRSNV